MDDALALPPAAASAEGTSRREFFANTCQALSALALAVAFEGCGGGSSSSNPNGPSDASNLPILNGTLSGNTITVAVDSIAVGSAALVSASNAAVLVAHPAADTYTALSATCTHQACTVTTWAAPNFQCPCHGARYDVNGAVVRGPAVQALTKYNTSLSGTTLTIS